MVKAKQHEKKKSKYRTPSPKTKEMEKPIIGSSCTWGKDELNQFNVKMRQNVDAKEMIPLQVFEFKHLDKYEECIFLTRLCAAHV
jgi:hypothetical protein